MVDLMQGLGAPYNPLDTFAKASQTMQNMRMGDQQEADAIKKREQQEKMKELAGRYAQGDYDAIPEMFNQDPELALQFKKDNDKRISEVGEVQNNKIRNATTVFLARLKETPKEEWPAMAQKALENDLIDIEGERAKAISEGNEFVVDAGLVGYMGADNYKQLMESKKGKESKEFAPSISTPQVDPETGQQYVIVTDANTQQTKRVDVKGGKALTGDQKMQLDVEKGLLNQASEISKDAFTQIANVKRSIGTIDEAISALDKGASTGVISQYLPSFSESTISLENAANRMGLDIISATTFGALSEGELKLAMATAVPLRLEPNELKTWLKDKKKAQLKLASELNKMAIALGKGRLTPAEYLEKVGYQEAESQVEQVSEEAKSNAVNWADL